MNVEWIKCQGDVWCNLSTVNLEHSHFNNMSGVYVIWHGGSNPSTVYVGQGFIRDRLKAHRNKPEIQQYQSINLYVTWAAAPDNQLDGIERYLADSLQPKEGSSHPNATPIPVNSPW